MTEPTQLDSFTKMDEQLCIKTIRALQESLTAAEEREKESANFWDAAMSQSVGLRYDYETGIVTNERAEIAEAQLAAIRNAPVPEMPERYFHPAYDNYMYVDYLVERIITTLTRKVAALEAQLKAKGDAGGWIAEGEVQS